MLYFRVELPRSSVFGRLSKIKRVPSSILIIAVKHLFVIDFSSLPYHLVVLEGSCRKKRERKKKKKKKRKEKVYTLVKVQPVQQQLVIISADKTRVGIERRTKTMDTRRDADGTSSSGTTCVDKFIRIAVGFTIKRATAFVGHSR